MYYVYQYIDPTTHLPFYIGKGSDDRKFYHLSETIETTINKRKYYRIQRIKKQGLDPIVEEIKSFDNEEDAYAFEEYLISFYGRKGYDKGGILMNICKDSRPPSRKNKKLTVDQRNKMKERFTKEVKEEMSARMKGSIPWNKGKKGVQVAWNKGLTGIPGHPHSAETKQLLREANIGKRHSAESKEKMSKNMKGRIPWSKGKHLKPTRSIPCYFISPEGIEYEYSSVKQGCIAHNLPTGPMCNVRTGKKSNYNGWTVRTKENK